MYFYKITTILLLGLSTSIFGKAQGNCLLYPEHSGERIACELSYRAIEYPQGSRESQILFDAAIRIGPNYAWAYYEKSVAYFKRGLLAEGIALINRAVDIEPHEYLDYRAYWYYQHRSLEHCIADLERYYRDFEGPITHTPGGDMEMRLLLGLAYAQMNEPEKAMQSALHCFQAYQGREYLIGQQDYHILGLLAWNNRAYEQAEKAFLNQIEMDAGLADTYYYLGLIKKQQGKDAEAKSYFNKAIQRLNGEEGGYSLSVFALFNVQIEMVMKEIGEA